MEGYNAQEILNCYDLTAKEYADKFLNELDGKPFDRNILDRFTQLLPNGSVVYDFGCGSGQTTKYLFDKKVHKIIGLDFSENSIRLASRNFPEITFIVDDMLNSKMASNSVEGIIAFYSIVHFTYTEVEKAFKEWWRLLETGAFCLFSFHIGEGSVEISDFLGVKGANAVWRLLEMDKILTIAEKVGFTISEAIIRYPYKGVEHETKRGYITLKKSYDSRKE
ncbi:MAG: class I SAM-dependent methyltransferase [Candidatus Riflebacteria bacterium]|nr:class I SAM-dependent methyltransferase [Candidatus Riflebacteria bacterium]